MFLRSSTLNLHFIYLTKSFIVLSFHFHFLYILISVLLWEFLIFKILSLILIWLLCCWFQGSFTFSLISFDLYILLFYWIQYLVMSLYLRENKLESFNLSSICFLCVPSPTSLLIMFDLYLIQKAFLNYLLICWHSFLFAEWVTGFISVMAAYVIWINPYIKNSYKKGYFKLIEV